MENVAKKFSPAIFGLILICFFLPFTDISCSGQKVATFTGIQLVTGTTIQYPFEQPSMFGEKGQVRKVDSEPLAILAFFCGCWIWFKFSKKSKKCNSTCDHGGCRTDHPATT